MRDSPGWQFYNPVRIVAAPMADALAELVAPAREALLVTSAGFTRRGISARIAQLLEGVKLNVVDEIEPNPDLIDLDLIAKQLHGTKAQVVLALGGGSVLDAAKVLARTIPLREPRPLEALLRHGQEPVWQGRLPVVAVPTTAGTGAEATPFATVWDHSEHRKHSLDGREMFPVAALLDAELTLNLPHEQTLYPGLDTVSHALESLWNRNCSPASRSIAMQALRLSAQALPLVLRQPYTLAERRRMQEASVLAGIAISQTRTALAHAVSYPVTAHFGVPHGLACSFTLPEILRANLHTLATNAQEHAVLSAVLSMLEELELPRRMARYVTLAQLVSLHAEMYTPGRSDNYVGPDMGSLTQLLARSLQ